LAASAHSGRRAQTTAADASVSGDQFGQRAYQPLPTLWATQLRLRLLCSALDLTCRLRLCQSALHLGNGGHGGWRWTTLRRDPIRLAAVLSVGGLMGSVAGV